MLAKATGGKPASAAAEPFLRAQRWRSWPPAGRRWPTRGGRRGGHAAEIDAALADLKAWRSSRSTATWRISSKVSRSVLDDLRRQLAWNVVWQRYLGRYVTRVERRLFPGPSRRVGRQPGFGEPYPAAAGGRRRKNSPSRPAGEGGRGHPPRDSRREDFLRRGGATILGRAPPTRRPAGRNLPPRGHGRGLLAGRLRPGSRRGKPAGPHPLRRPPHSLRRRPPAPSSWPTSARRWKTPWPASCWRSSRPWSGVDEGRVSRRRPAFPAGDARTGGALEQGGRIKDQG